MTSASPSSVPTSADRETIASQSAPPTLDQMEQHLLTLLTSSSQLLSSLSDITATSAEESKQHANTFLTTMQQLRVGLMYAISHLPSERTYRRSSYLDTTMFDVECDMTEVISERLEAIERWNSDRRDRRRNADQVDQQQIAHNT